MHHIRAITLDLDNTLWEIDPVIRQAEERMWAWLAGECPRVVAEFSAEDVVDIRTAVFEEHQALSHDLGFLRRKVLETIITAAGYSDDAVEPAFAVFYSARNEVELFPDVLPALEHLFERFAVVAVTNGNACLETIGIRHLFHDVVTAADAGAAKPARAIFDVAVERGGYAAGETLHVGDHPETDIDGAREAGLYTAWVNRNNEEWPEHLSAPDVVVSTITELRELLE